MDLLKLVLEWLIALVSEKSADANEDVPKYEVVPPKPIGIDWTNAKSQVSKYFTVGEAATLHSWDRLANDADGFDDSVKVELVKLCGIMDEIRDLLGCPISVHCMFRSVQYNQEVLKSLPNDVHSKGMAIDIDCNAHMTIEQVKEKVRPVLEKYNIRLEGGTTTWVHLDTHAVGPSGREFKA